MVQMKVVGMCGCKHVEKILFKALVLMSVLATSGSSELLSVRAEIELWFLLIYFIVAVSWIKTLEVDLVLLSHSEFGNHFIF